MKRTLDGCDALLHAAGVLSLDPNQAEEMARINPDSTDLLLRTGRDLGLDPLVYWRSRYTSLDSQISTPSGNQ